MLFEGLYIEKTKDKGRGVFTRLPIPAETIIEISPVIVMGTSDRLHLDQSLLHDYIFEWGADRDRCAMALGYVPMYNHGYASNCEYFMNFDDGHMMIKTVRDIEPQEELTINYNGDWNDATPVWFDPVS